MKLTNTIRGMFRRAISFPDSTLSYPSEWLFDSWGGGSAASGVVVNANTALTYSAVWRALMLVSRDVAKLPLNVFRRDGAGKVRAMTHPAYRLLRRRPNEYMTDFAFKQAMTTSAMMLGNAYALITRDGRGSPVSLDIMPSDSTYPVRENGMLSYVNDSEGSLTRFRADSVFHLRGFTWDGIVGESLIAKARDSIGVGLAAQTYTATFFKNGARPATVLEIPGTVPKERLELLRTQWERMYSGVDQAHRTAILEKGMKANSIGIDNQRQQLNELREHELRHIANWFSLPPHKLGDSTKSSFASLEQENQSYLDDALDPHLVAWESEAFSKLLTVEQQRRESHVVEFNREAIVRVQFNAKVAGINSAIQGGWMSRDEGRGLLNMNPIENGEGGKFFQPLNLGIVGEAEADGEPTDERPARSDRVGGDASAELMALAADAMGRTIRRVTASAARAAKRPATFSEWIDNHLRQSHESDLLDAVAPVAAAVTSCTGREPDLANLSGLFFTGIQDCLVSSRRLTDADVDNLKHLCAKELVYGTQDDQQESRGS